MRLGATYVSEGVYKDIEEISNEYLNLKEVTPNMMSHPSFFHKTKTFFLQVEPDVDFIKEHFNPDFELNQEMHPHYYWIQKAARKQGSPMFAYKLYAKDFKGADNIELLKNVFNVDSYEQLNNTFYILVNQERSKLPIGGRLSNEHPPSSVPCKFVTNPLKAQTEDDIFDLLDANKHQPIKYFIIYNPNNFLNEKKMTVGQIMFRKFFYEHSGYLEGETQFIEITDRRLAKKVLNRNLTQNTIYAV